MLFRFTLTGWRCKNRLLVIASERSSGLSGQPCRKNERHTRDSVIKRHRFTIRLWRWASSLMNRVLYKLHFFGESESFHLHGLRGATGRAQATADTAGRVKQHRA